MGDLLDVIEETCRAMEMYAGVPPYAMRVGPGTDAVVWKICDTNETVEL